MSKEIYLYSRNTRIKLFCRRNSRRSNSNSNLQVTMCFATNNQNAVCVTLLDAHAYNIYMQKSEHLIYIYFFFFLMNTEVSREEMSLMTKIF